MVVSKILVLREYDPTFSSYFCKPFRVFGIFLKMVGHSFDAFTNGAYRVRDHDMSKAFVSEEN